MKRKTLLFFSLLLVALSAGAQATTLWKASASGSAGSDYMETVYSMPKESTTTEQSAFEGSDGNFYYNTKNDEFYMYIKPAAFTNVKTKDKICVNITWAQDNNQLYFKNPKGAEPSEPSSCEENYGTTTPSKNSWTKLEVTEEMATKLKTNGLYIGGTYFNWTEVKIEPYVPLTISAGVTERFNNITNKRASWTPAMKMDENGYASWEYDGNGKVVFKAADNHPDATVNTSTYFDIAKGSLQDVQVGDILWVLVENVQELSFDEIPTDDANQQPRTKTGNKGAWAGLCVSDGWLAPKYHCFPIQGHFCQVLDKHMVDLIKDNGLRIKGCKFQLDYVVIEKAAQSHQTEDDATTEPVELFNGEAKLSNDWVAGAEVANDKFNHKATNGDNITVTYSTNREAWLQIKSNDKYYGAITPSEGGPYTVISGGENVTVDFKIDSDDMATNLNTYGMKLATGKGEGVTITKIELKHRQETKRISKVTRLKSPKNEYKYSTKDIKSENFHWGDILHIVYKDANQNAPIIKIHEKEIGQVINLNGDGKEYFAYLDYKEYQALANSASMEEEQYFTITAGEGAEIESAYILPEVRERNKGSIKVNGNVNWSSSERVQAYLGQVEVGDKITVETSTVENSNPQFQASIMHNGEYNTKGLAYNNYFSFSEIYDVLTYSDGSARADEYIGNPGNKTFTVESQAMANALSNYPFTISGQELHVDNIIVDSKAFIYPATVGSDDTPRLWATMCAPYNISMPDDSNIKAYIVTGVGTEMQDHVYPLTLTQISQIPAGTPVLLCKDKSLEGKETQYRFNIIDDKDKFKGDDISGNLLCGDVARTEKTTLMNNAIYTYYAMTYKKDNFGDNRQAFYKIADGGVQVNAYKAYLRIENAKNLNAKGFVFMFDKDNGTTGITGIENDTKTAQDVYYNLNGQRISKPAKGGIYICNGKKIIVK